MSKVYKTHQNAKRRERKDELAKERENKKCPRCGSKPGVKGKIKVLGVLGEMIERPCPVCNFGR